MEENVGLEPTVALSGGFDPIHKGHVRMILEAAEYGDVIVILNSDEWLHRKKGFVFMEYDERAEVVLAIKGVIDVVLAKDEDDTVCESLIDVQPTYFANGGDRKDDNVPEVELCNSMGIKMLWNIGGGKIQSSSELVKRGREHGN